MRMEAEVGRKHLQAKELRMLGCDPKLGAGHRADVPSESSEGANPADNLSSDLGPPGLQDNAFLLH